MQLTIKLSDNEIDPQATVETIVGELKSVFPQMCELKLEGSRVRGFEPVSDDMLKEDGSFVLPTRATSGSAGYEFVVPKDFTLMPGEKIFFWTNVKVYMQPGEVFLLTVRSSAGVGKDLQLSNTTGMIDNDYYDNEKTGGNIGIALRNIGEKQQVIKKGEKFVQGFFTTFLVADDDTTTAIRKGGFGSTTE